MRSALIWVSAVLISCGGGGAGNGLPDAPVAADAATDAPAVACSTALVATHQGTISASETWAAGVHRVTGSITVSAGTLTIAPCATVQLAANASITLGTAATALIASGTDAQPIRFARDAAAQPWGRLEAFAPATLSLAHATLVGGGTAGDYKTAEELGSTIEARAGGANLLAAILTVNDVTVDGSSGIGVFLNGGRFTPGSTGLTVKNSGFHPILLGADSATDLPDGAYTGNAVDAILLQSAGTAAAFDQSRTVLADTVLHDRGVPYRVGVLPTTIPVGSNVAGDPLATLTIEAGATLQFVPEGTTSSSRLSIRQAGALVVAGTAAKPVVFTSAAATPAAGDWQGIEFRNLLDPTSHIDHAEIDYAGGASFAVGVCEWKAGSSDLRELAAVIFSVPDGDQPAAGAISNTHIAHSAGAAIYRGWKANDVDLLGTNTFDDIAGCLESDVPNASNACPTTACPMM